MNFVPLRPMRFDNMIADRDRLVRQMAGMMMVPPDVLIATDMNGTNVFMDSFNAYQKHIADGLELEATRYVRKFTDQFWAAEMKRKHKEDIGRHLTRWAESMRDGRPHELDGVATYVRELVFDHPESEWTARLSILADYLRDTATHPEAYQTGELLGELLAEGFTLSDGVDA